MRAALGNLRAAAETLDAYPEMEIVRRTRLFRVLVEEVERLSSAVSELEATARESRPGNGEEVTVEQLVVDLEAWIAEPGMRLALAPADPAHSSALVAVPTGDFGQRIARVTSGLFSEFGIRNCTLAVGIVEEHLRLDLSWMVPESGAAASSSWVLDSLAGSPRAGGDSCALREFVREHGGEVWFAIDRDESAAHLRFLLPLIFSPAVA